jgi:uncharacterized protein with gpF-like domain
LREREKELLERVKQLAEAVDAAKKELLDAAASGEREMAAVRELVADGEKRARELELQLEEKAKLLEELKSRKAAAESDEVEEKLCMLRLENDKLARKLEVFQD